MEWHSIDRMVAQSSRRWFFATALLFVAQPQAVLAGPAPASTRPPPARSTCRIFYPRDVARCEADLARANARADAMAASGTDENGVRRKPGPGCVRWSPYAANCQTPEERRVSMGLPTAAQDRAGEAARWKQVKADEAAAAAEHARAVSDPAAKACAKLSFHPVDVIEYSPQEHLVSRLRNGMENECSFPVRFQIREPNGMKWTTVPPDRWVQFGETDSWTGVIRRAN